jgi:sugar/nucleoside kinase (ribokinase family)
LDYLQIIPDVNSGFAYVFFTEDGPTLCFSHPIQAPNVKVSNSIFNQVDLVVINPRLSAIPEHLVQQVIGLTVPVAIVGIADAAIMKLFSQTMLLSLNVNETKHLSEALGGISVEAITERMPGYLYETNGDKGCKIYQRGEMVAQVAAIPPKEMIDSTGAGDTFSAGVLAGLRRGFEVSEAAQIGAAAASYVLEAFGCHTNMPDWTKISKRLRKSNTRLAQRIVSEVNK